MASGLKSVTSDTHRPGFLVVETNYRIYAYTGNFNYVTSRPIFVADIFNAMAAMLRDSDYYLDLTNLII